MLSTSEVIQRWLLTETCLKICKTNKTWETIELRNTSRTEGREREGGDRRGVTETKRNTNERIAAGRGCPPATSIGDDEGDK